MLQAVHLSKRVISPTGDLEILKDVNLSIRPAEAVAVVGERERVIASTDCGFGTFTGREWVASGIVWKKLAALRQGADIASARLWGRAA